MIGALVMVACIFMMVRMMSHGGPGHGSHGGFEDQSKRSAGDILAERFARGEISEDEFEQRRRVLEHRPS